MAIYLKINGKVCWDTWRGMLIYHFRRVRGGCRVGHWPVPCPVKVILLRIVINRTYLKACVLTRERKLKLKFSIPWPRRIWYLPPHDPLKNLTCAAHNTKKYAIFVHVKSAYYSHKPNFRGLNNRLQIYKIVTKEHVYRRRICGGLDIFL